MAPVFPKDGGAAFGTDHRIVGVFHDEHAVGDTDAESAAGAALPDNHSNNGCLKQHHFP